MCKTATVWLPPLQHLYCPMPVLPAGEEQDVVIQSCGCLPGTLRTGKAHPRLPSLLANGIPSRAAAGPVSLLVLGRTCMCSVRASVGCEHAEQGLAQFA